ncbi:amino acid adenylation domain-containing protein [Catenulispora subtropica]|uniref:AMP-dependent synthetase and ligase n=1 Tax=Catenulispora subtropica TaxID=450798 RepID=A0ABP5E483_9ACTN
MDTPGHVLEPIAAVWDRDPDRPAVTDPDGTLDYGGMNETSAAVAALLREQGVQAGEPVAVHMAASRWAIAALIGVLRAGACFVAVDRAFPPGRQEAMLEASGARVVLDGHAIRQLKPHSDNPDNLDKSDNPEPEPEPEPDFNLDPADRWQSTEASTPAYICFTSGSTGVPKGVAISVSALAFSTAARPAYYSEPVRGFVLCSSLSFDSAYAGIFWALIDGGTLHMPSPRPGDLLAIGRAAREQAASHLLMIPSLYGVALKGGLAENLRGLDAVIVAGEACPPSLVRAHFEALPEVALYNEYGPTECTVWTTVHRCSPEDVDTTNPTDAADTAVRTVPIGTPIPGARLHISAEDSELWIGGPGVALGYTGPGVDDDDRARFFTDESGLWYRTGDRVTLRPDGAFAFAGRVDRQLKVGGVRIEPEEIEAVVSGHESVIAAGVTAVPPILVAVLETADGAPVPLGRLRAHLRSRLPAAAIPSEFVFVDALPRLPNGKLDRNALDQLVPARTGSVRKPLRNTDRSRSA